MEMGATLIDLDNTTGYISTKSVMGSPRSSDQTVSDPKTALSLYPLIIETELENGSHDEDDSLVTMACAWINGFIPHSRGLPVADQRLVCLATNAILQKYGIVLSDQAFKSRPDDRLNSLFTAFKWYGKKDSDPIMPAEVCIDTAIKDLTYKGLVHTNWFNSPLPIRYMVHMRGNKDTHDFVYFIGGSPELLRENMSETSKDISSLWKSVKIHAEEARNADRITVTCSQMLGDPRRVWFQIDDLSEDEENHPWVKSRLEMRRLNRMMQGVIYIRNALYYLKNYMKLEEIIEFDYNKGEPKTLKLEDVLQRYQSVYTFVRNLCDLREELAMGVIG
jgi:hypothetical protein